MGSILSRRIAGVEDIDIQANSAYRFPPKSGKWRLNIDYYFTEAKSWSDVSVERGVLFS